MMQNTQTLVFDTIMGERMLLAPEGWTFDKTAIQAWRWMLRHQNDLDANKVTTKRGRLIKEGQIEVLAHVLASSLGMASTYWELECRRIAKAETRVS